MRTTLLLLVLGLSLAPGACSRKAPADKQSKRSPSQPQAAEVCTQDRDCVLTRRRLKQCCVDCSGPYAVHRSRAAAIDRWHRVNCKPGTVHCAMSVCTTPGSRARCKDRRCVTDVTL